MPSGSPYCTLVQEGADGYSYGTATGHSGSIIFRASTNGGYVLFYLFTGGIDGANPRAGLTEGSDGMLYGTTSQGVTYGDGTVFKIDTSGHLTVLAQFAATNGAFCRAPLALGKDGNFYGTTENGGTNDNGTLFQITPRGVLTTLWCFSGADDGALPFDALVPAGNGIFYGMANFGKGENGTLFRLDLTPSLQPISRNGSTLTLGWAAVPGLKYAIQYRTNLSQGDWMDLAGTNAATNTVMQTMDSIGPDIDRFYRAVLFP